MTSVAQQLPDALTGWGFRTTTRYKRPASSGNGVHGFANGVQFERWASGALVVVNDKTVQARFGVSRATAYRWIAEWKALA